MKTKTKIALGVLAAAALAVACWRLAPPAAEPAPGPQEAPASEQPAEQQEEPDGLTERQHELQARYDGPLEETLAFLEASTWSTPNESASLSFEPGAYAERSAGAEEARVPFAVELATTSVARDSGAVITRQTLVLDVGEGTSLLYFYNVTAADGSVSYSLTSDGFAHAQTYLWVSPAREVAVEGLGEEMLSLVDGRGDLLAQRLSEYCALYYPTASAATFNGQATVSWDEGTVSFSLALDTRTRPDIPVTYDKSTLDFMVGKGAHR